MFVRHSPSAAIRKIAPTIRWARDEDAKVVTLRWDELLNEHALLLEPRHRGESCERVAERVLVGTEA